MAAGDPVIDTASYQGWFIGRTMTESEAGSNLITETYIIRKKGGGGGEPPSPAVPMNYLLLDPTTEYNTLKSEDVIPEIGVYFDFWSPAGGSQEFGKACACIGTEIVCNKDGSITATHTFASRLKFVPAGGTSTSAFPPEVEFLTTQRQAEEFRHNSTTLSVTAPPSGSDKSASDIGGVAIKNGSEKGMIVTYSQVRIRIRRHFEAQVTANLNKVVEHFKDFLGTRNTSTFMGFPEKTVQFDGFNMVKVEGPFYEVVFDMTFDEKFFHSQVPEYDIDGVPKMNATGTEFSDVRWVRTSATTKDFNEVFFDSITGSPTAANIDTEMQTYAESGYW
jgi:hypothetical protein